MPRRRPRATPLGSIGRLADARLEVDGQEHARYDWKGKRRVTSARGAAERGSGRALCVWNVEDDEPIQVVRLKVGQQKPAAVVRKRWTGCSYPTADYWLDWRARLGHLASCWPLASGCRGLPGVGPAGFVFSRLRLRNTNLRKRPDLRKRTPLPLDCAAYSSSPCTGDPSDCPGLFPAQGRGRGSATRAPPSRTRQPRSVH